MTKPNLIAVPNAAPTTAGAIVYWRLSGGLDLDRLRAAWEAEQLDTRLLPEEPSPTVALRRAVSTLKKPDTRIEATRAGLVVLRRREVADGELEFDKRLTASVDIVGRIRVGFAADPVDAETVTTAYDVACRTLVQADVSPWLATLMRDLKAVPLRDTGGVYFVPRFAGERFEAMLRALRAATGHVIAAIPAMDSGEAVAAVLDALQAEAETELATIRKELEEEQLGERALATRIRTTSSVEAKLSAYEGLLGSNLDALRERITNMRAELTVAMTKAQLEAEKAS
jgi:hypothetical protein